MTVADDGGENAVNAPPVADGDALATIELPHEDLDPPLDDGPADDGRDVDASADESAAPMADTSGPAPADEVADEVSDAAATASLPPLAEDVSALTPAETPSIWRC